MIIPLRQGRTRTVHRIIPARYPQIDLFERVASPEGWDILFEIESLTNPRLRDETGDIRLVPTEDRVFGPGSSWIMSAFTHPPVDGSGGRFNLDFGVFYCSPSLAVCIAESTYHQARFLRESRIERETLEMRVLHARLKAVALHDIRQLDDDNIYHPQDYSAGQALGRRLKSERSYGIRYRSVRHRGECIAVLRPPALGQAGHLRYLRYRYEEGTIVAVQPLHRDHHDDEKSNARRV